MRKFGAIMVERRIDNAMSNLTQKDTLPVTVDIYRTELIKNVNHSKQFEDEIPKLRIFYLWFSGFLMFIVIRHVMCGTLQCKDGESKPEIPDAEYSRTFGTIKGIGYECK